MDEMTTRASLTKHGLPERCVICDVAMPCVSWPMGWTVLFDHGWYCPEHQGTAMLVHESIEADVTERVRAAAALAYPDHHPDTALANYQAGREVWDTNGDMW